MIASTVCVVPAYRADRTLAGVVGALRGALAGATIVVVDDGSDDATAGVARDCADEVVRFERNRGKGAALRAGFAAALDLGARAILTIDADGQHDPSAAPVLLAALDRADIVIGARARGGSMPFGRRLTNRMSASAVGALVGRAVPDVQSGYRALRRVVVERVRGEGDRYEFETDFLIRAYRAGFTVATVPVPVIYGPRSHFRLLTDSMRIVRTIWRHRAPAIA